MSSREQNEKRFKKWEILKDGGRLYRRTVVGQRGWEAVYCKQVDAKEQIIKFWQEIFDERGNLWGIHEKYPVDKGHKEV
jgi:hypothetical protein